MIKNDITCSVCSFVICILIGVCVGAMLSLNAVTKEEAMWQEYICSKQHFTDVEMYKNCMEQPLGKIIKETWR